MTGKTPIDGFSPRLDGWGLPGQPPAVIICRFKDGAPGYRPASWGWYSGRVSLPADAWRETSARGAR